VDSALPVKILDGVPHFSPRKLLHHLFQFWVFLPYDLFELHRLHASVLKLREGSPGFDCFVLPSITYQQDAVVRIKPFQKLVHLPGRSE
jgi:hypothetical protein